MARIRTIKPEFFTSEDIVSVSPLARLFYVSLWCEADREGRLEWKPGTFKMRYLPGDNCDVGVLADELVGRGLVVLYTVSGKRYAMIPTFKRHQVINNRESSSELPPPEVDACLTRESAVKAEGRKGKEGREGSSEAKASGGEPPSDDSKAEDKPDPQRELYQAGKSLLHAQGMPKDQCGSFITKLAQDYGKEAALEAVRSAVVAQPLEAAAYLKATCQRLKGERRDPITVPSTDKRADDFLAEQEARAKAATRPPAAILELAGRVGRTA